jgi:hypothetical protein
MITHEQVAQSLSPQLMCELGGGHEWDTGPGYKRLQIHPTPVWTKRECVLCHQYEDNPDFDPVFRKEYFQKKARQQRLDKTKSSLLHWTYE